LEVLPLSNHLLVDHQTHSHLLELLEETSLLKVLDSSKTVTILQQNLQQGLVELLVLDLLLLLDHHQLLDHQQVLELPHQWDQHLVVEEEEDLHLAVFLAILQPLEVQPVHQLLGLWLLDQRQLLEEEEEVLVDQEHLPVLLQPDNSLIPGDKLFRTMY